MRIAFKEWAIVADALGSGAQILILRKGGIKEGRSGFQVEHSLFLLFPTQFHQQRESVIEPAQARFDQIAPSFPHPDRLRIEHVCEVATWQRLDSLAAAERLRGQHIWRDEVIRQRFDWGRDKSIHALAVRVRRLPQAIELPMLPGYGGCKSWIELEEDISIQGAEPILSDDAFTLKLNRFQEALRAPCVEPSMENAKAASLGAQGQVVGSSERRWWVGRDSNPGPTA
ncbi:MAG: DUF1802 family protein [Verrucomicrobia bacterium]|nr:DUF1802 family protein [Verrucomicrobiota bacterium]